MRSCLLAGWLRSLRSCLLTGLQGRMEGDSEGSAEWLEGQGLWRRFMRSCPLAGWQREVKMGLKASGE